MIAKTLSLRADLPVVVTVCLDDESSKLGGDDLDWSLWASLLQAFKWWWRVERFTGSLRNTDVTERGIVDLLQRAHKSDIFLKAFRVEGIQIQAVDVMQLSPVIAQSLPSEGFHKAFGLDSLLLQAPPDLTWSDEPPLMTTFLTAADLNFAKGEGLPIVWEASYADLVNGCKHPYTIDTYGPRTLGMVEIAGRDGSFVQEVPDGMSVAFAPIIDWAGDVTLLESSIFATRAFVEEWVQSSSTRPEVRAAKLARIIYDRKPLGLSEHVMPNAVSVIAEEDQLQVQVTFDDRGDTFKRTAIGWNDKAKVERAVSYARESASRLAQAMNVPIV